ncbi:hypothetical protein [Brevundimonas sp. NIBR11]|uniref:hypothetical protein n=1 Tax=Brevundimonas sp. NIBR11 TaxID=3015999 RepID=UPI0022F0B0BF|nr:hypothetical protein [Brevundimonas sp. NIBR11]WGM31852.1 hypothetical protein KKHFBJBL_02102 [Brevundimonas sp. NIBR11]
MSPGRPFAAVAVAGLALFGAASPALSQDLIDELSQAASPQPFSADDLLFMEVTADGYQLAETMNVYGSRGGVYVPLGEFSRVLDFAVGVFPAEGRAEGWFGSRETEVSIDLRRHQAVVGSVVTEFEPGQAAIYDGDIYLRTDLLEEILPLRLRADVNAQTLTVMPTQPLPFQERLAREQRAAGLGLEPAEVQATRIEIPYQMFSPPAFDVNLGGQIARDGINQSRSFDIRAAGDLAYAGFQGFLGSDQDGELNTARVLFERKDPGGRALGPLGATRAGIGDVFTPSMAIGAGSVSGRGAYYTSAPLEALDLSTPLDLRGELPLGEDVELYVNEVLQATQASATQGWYEFLDVPLTFGLNTIRLVFYGPQGQTREQVRRVNFGTGQVAAGTFVMRLGAVEQYRPVFDIGGPLPDTEAGPVRLSALFEYGLSPTLTLSGGAARYTPRGREARSVGLAGLRSSIGSVAAQIDVALDDQGGQAANLGLAGRPFGLSFVGRHSEYRGDFVDETRQFGLTEGVSLRRATDLRLDAQMRFGLADLPLSLDVRRVERTDQTDRFTAEARTSAPIDRYYVSTSLSYESEGMVGWRRDRLVGALDIATLIAARAQLRGGVSYELGPEAQLEAAYANLDFPVFETGAVRLGVIRALGETDATTLQASALYRAPRFDVSLTTAYETANGEWTVGLQFGFGFGFDPFSRRYRVTRPGVSSGGSAALEAFVDADGDGLKGDDEAAVSKVMLEAPSGAVVTGIDGQVIAAGLGDGAGVRMRVNLEGLDDPFLVGPMAAVEVVPRPGRTAVIAYPMQITSEAEVTVRLRRGDEARTLAAVDLRLVPVAGGEPIAARTDHSGTAFIEGLRPARYRVELDPEQAQTLGLSLEGAPEVVAPADGGFIRAGDVFIRIAGTEPQA